MRRPAVLTLIITILVIPAIPTGSADDLISDDDAVFNGDFETAAHPVRPVVCNVFGEGDVKILNPEAGLPWLASVNPCHAGVLKAAQWSSGTTVSVEDFDADGDREVRFIAGPDDPTLGEHNLWQAYASTQQGYVLNASAYEFDIIAGEVPDNAKVIFSVSTSPLGAAHPFVGPFLDCQLTVSTALIRASTTDGHVSVDLTEGTFRSRYVECDALQAAWNAAEPGSNERREILDSVRIVQHSFWNWNHGAADVVIDDVSLPGSRTVAEALVS